MSKRSSEYSGSKKDDSEYERRSKRKHDAPEPEPEPKPERESESDSEHISDTVDRQDGTKEQESQKEKADNDISETSRVQHVEEVTCRKPRKHQSLTIFTYKDEKKILKTLIKTGHTTCSDEFYTIVYDSLKLSILFNKNQLYGKIRRLRDKYLDRYKNNKTRKGMSVQQCRLYWLSNKIWKNEAKARFGQPHKKAKQEDVVEEDNYDVKLGKLVGEQLDVKFNVAESLDVVRASKRSKLQKKWNDMNGSMLKLFMARMDLIRETMGAVVSSPSFPSIHDD